MAEIIGWGTTENGVHYPIFAGQSNQEALQQFFKSPHGKAVNKYAAKSNKSINNSKITNFKNMKVEELQRLSDDILYNTDKDKLNSDGLNGNSSTQALVQRLDLNDKPKVINAAEFDKKSNNKDLLYRGAKSNTRNSNGITSPLNAEAVLNNLKYGNKTYIGEGFYGDGIYFTASKQSAINDYSDKSKNSVITAYLDKHKSNIINYNDLKVLQDNYSKSSKEAYELVNKGLFKETSNFALYKGYNVIKVEDTAWRGNSIYSFN